MTGCPDQDLFVSITGTRPVAGADRLTRVVYGRAPVSLTSNATGAVQNLQVILPPLGLAATPADITPIAIWPNIGGAGADQLGNSTIEITTKVVSSDEPSGLVITLDLEASFRHAPLAAPVLLEEVSYVLSIAQPLA